MLRDIANRAAVWETLPFSFEMEEKYNAKKEHQLQILAENRIQSGQYKIFDLMPALLLERRLAAKTALL